MTDQIRAPWAPEQVAALNRFQAEGGMHPFTCGGDHAPGSPALIAYTDGWRCSQPYGESCDYRQDWAHAFMADPDAWPKFPFGERHGPTPEEVRDWTPPPPGDTREQLPPAILALLPERAYTSTACDTAQQLGQVPPPKPTNSGAIPDVGWYVQMLHACCRRNQKFTGQLCACTCHGTTSAPGPAATEAPEPATVTDPEWLRQQYAAAVQPLLMDVLPKPIAAARAWEIVDTILFVRDRHLAQLRQRLELADADLGDGAAADEQARTTPDNSATSRDTADNPLREQYAAVIAELPYYERDDAGSIADAVLAVRNREMEQYAAAHIRDQAALTRIRLHIAVHRQRLRLADPVLLGKLEAVLRQVGELEAAGGGEGA